MKKDLIDKVLRYGVYDTRRFRYAVREVQTASEQHRVIVRIPLSVLDTSETIHGWEVVKVIKEGDHD